MKHGRGHSYKPRQIQRNWSPQLRQAAFEMWIDGNYTKKQISEALMIPLGSLNTIQMKDRWTERRQERVTALNEQYELNTAKLMEAAQPSFINEQINMRKTFDAVVKKKLSHLPPERMPVKDLVGLAAVFKTTNSVGMKITAMDRADRHSGPRMGPGSMLVTGGIVQVGLQPLGKSAQQKPEPIPAAIEVKAEEKPAEEFDF